ncbi:MAG: hypothetical protein ACYS8Y_09080 [Planctomycetota bacterium]
MKEFIEPIEDIEIDYAGYGQSGFAREPSEFGRRITIRIVREKSMAVQINISA